MRSIFNTVSLSALAASAQFSDLDQTDPNIAPSGKVDTIAGTNGNDTINMTDSKHSDVIFGNGGDDYITGSHHNDTLHGGNGNDVLIGNGGKDVMYGDGGIDIFVFSTSGSTRIMDLHNADDINTTMIDADSTQDGMQSFVMVNRFDHHAGELVEKYNAEHNETRILLDTDGDGKANLTEFIDGDHRDFSNWTL